MLLQINSNSRPNLSFEKFIEFILILHGNGRPIYSNFSNKQLVSQAGKSNLHSGLVSAITSYSKSINSGSQITSIKLTGTEIYFCYDTKKNLIFVIGIKFQAVNVCKRDYLVKQFSLKLQHFFDNELSITDWSSLNSSTQFVINKQINIISNSVFNKVTLKFCF